MLAGWAKRSEPPINNLFKLTFYTRLQGDVTLAHARSELLYEERPSWSPARARGLTRFQTHLMHRPAETHTPRMFRFSRARLARRAHERGDRSHLRRRVEGRGPTIPRRSAGQGRAGTRRPAQHFRQLVQPGADQLSVSTGRRPGKKASTRMRREFPGRRKIFSGICTDCGCSSTAGNRAALSSFPGASNPRHHHSRFGTEFGADVLLTCQGAPSLMRWRGKPLMKNVFDFAMYPVLIAELRPLTVFEIGSGSGASAAWFADLLALNGADGRVHSVDIAEVQMQHPMSIFIRAIAQRHIPCFPPNFCKRRRTPGSWSRTLITMSRRDRFAAPLSHPRRLSGRRGQRRQTRRNSRIRRCPSRRLSRRYALHRQFRTKRNLRG